MVFVKINNIRITDILEFVKLFFHLSKIFLLYRIRFKFVLIRKLDKYILNRNLDKLEIDIFIEPYMRIVHEGIEEVIKLLDSKESKETFLISDQIYVHHKVNDYIHLPSYSPILLSQINYLKNNLIFLKFNDRNKLLHCYKSITKKNWLTVKDLGLINFKRLKSPILVFKKNHTRDLNQNLNQQSFDYSIEHHSFQETPRISVIIPSTINDFFYGHGKFKLLEKLSELELYFSTTFEIIIIVGPEVNVNNLNSLIKHHTNIIVIKDDNEFNFSKRVNAGIMVSTSEYIWILNDDIEIEINEDLRQDFGVIFDLLKNKETGVVGTFLLNSNGDINHAGIEIKFKVADHFLRGTPFSLKQACNLFKVREVIGVTAANIFLRRHSLFELGLFDERYPMNFNDLELCLRFHKNKMQNYVIRSYNFTHFESMTRNRKLKENRALAEILEFYNVNNSEDDFNFFIPNCCINTFN